LNRSHAMYDCCQSHFTRYLSFRGLYGGIGIHLMRSVPNAAVMFVTFEVASKWLLAKQIKESNKSEISDDKVIVKKLNRKSSAFVTPIHFKINPTSSIMRL
jgi:Mitochondrial carrier protein